MAGKDRSKDLAKALRAPFDGGFRLADSDPDAFHGLAKRGEAKRRLPGLCEHLRERQSLLFAGGKHAVLVVLQAMDTGGKDGTIRHVFGPLNPQGVRVTNFKVPSAEERAHDYLWRIHRAVPPRGIIGIFNRSHYEDVLVVRVHGLAPKPEIERRYDQINAFEKMLAENGVTILKFFLHIGRDEQKRRLQARLDRPDKHWKFSAADLAERKLWDDYEKAYELALARCSTPWAPWYVIPANHKPYRNWAVATLVLGALDSLGMAYPAPEPGLESLVID
jgi:PPK2 family polyphosphate:nucleotide phosphotransferase